MRQPRNKMAYFRMTKIWSQYDVAKMLGISQSYYAKIEKDPQCMSVAMALRIKGLLNAPSIEVMLEVN